MDYKKKQQEVREKLKPQLVKGYQFNQAPNRRSRRLSARRSGYLGRWKMFTVSPGNNRQTVINVL